MQFYPLLFHFFPVRYTVSSQRPYLQTHPISKIGGHSDSKYQECGLLGCDIVLAGTQATMFRQGLLLPSSWHKTVSLNLNLCCCFLDKCITACIIPFSTSLRIRIPLHDRSITISSIRLLGKLHTLQYFPSFIATHPHFRRIKRAPVCIYIYIPPEGSVITSNWSADKHTTRAT